MPHITVDAEQAKIIREASGDIEIRDPSGRRLGYVSHGFSAEALGKAKERVASAGPWLTTGEVLDHLQSLPTP